MKFVEPRPYADPDAAARKLVEIASTIEPMARSRIGKRYSSTLPSFQNL